jgi:hypothetical protein
MPEAPTRGKAGVAAVHAHARPLGGAGDGRRTHVHVDTVPAVIPSRQGKSELPGELGVSLALVSARRPAARYY